MYEARERSEVAIVGGGFGGLAMAIRLRQQGIEDFVLLERGDDVGGAWTFNTYPGCMCDVPSHLYSLSFAPNPGWSHTYSPQAEIRDYLRNTAERFGIRTRVRTNVEVEAAAWNEDDAIWEIETSEGPLQARVLVSATGPLTEPLTPAISGLERFEGEVFHSARWNHDFDLAGKRVASIGTGASAIQYVPAIQPEVERLHVFQRTAPWVMPHNDRPIGERERELFRRAPLAQRLLRAGIYWARELLVLGFVKEPRLMRQLERLARGHMRKQISDPELREKVVPDYTLGCKRMIPSNRWYPALGKPNVELVTAGVAEVREGSIVDADGIEHEVDAIIFGTGFHVTDIPVADRIRGRDDTLLSDAWAGSPRAYMGTAVPGFPNLFMLLGPNTGLGHSSMVFMIESQVQHVLAALQEMRSAGAVTIEVRPEAYAAYNRDVDERLRGTVWDVGGCSSFYDDETGRNATLWPDFTWRFRRLASRVDPDAYRLGTPKPAAVPA